MKIAVIDLGTNTFNLLIVEKNGTENYKKLASNRIPVKLGEGAINKGYIAEEPFARGIDALKAYSKIINEKNVDKVVAYATSAIRSADNGKEFIDNVKKETGIEVEIIDGNREAELIYYGTRQAVSLSDDWSLIMDIGGGSTEFIIANKNEIAWKESFLLGAARLIEFLEPSDPITEDEIQKVNNHLRMELGSLFSAVKKYKITELVGSSGAFDSIVDMLSHEYNSEVFSEDKTEYKVNLEEYLPFSEQVIRASYKQRLQIKGLIEMRVDMIVISCLFVNFILKELQLKQFRVSTYALKEGVLYHI
jgi:exopolyphosphatase/guanosine-5'-triphosphate,3'-diphosphate pyrophosphatase